MNIILYCLLFLPSIIVCKQFWTVSFHLIPIQKNVFEPLGFTIHYDELGQSKNFSGLSAYSNHSHYYKAIFLMQPNANVSEFKIKFDQADYVQKSILVQLPEDGQTDLKVTTKNYKLFIKAGVNKSQQVSVAEQPNGCHCIKKNCACCSHFNLPRFHHSICVNISYNAETIGLDLSIGIDDHYYTQEISARNPPPICFAVPGLHDVASLCIAFTELDLAKKHLNGCLDLEAELIHMKIVQLKLGCFHMPI